MVLRAITGVRTPACLSATSNPVEAVTPPFWVLTDAAFGAQRTVLIISFALIGILFSQVRVNPCLPVLLA
jgi:hypothetical protein